MNPKAISSVLKSCVAPLLLVLLLDCIPVHSLRAASSRSATGIARWNGGPLELKRRELLRDLPSERSRLEKALRDWYLPQSLDLLKQAKVNEVWLTWSVGLPESEEKESQRAVQDYMRVCRQAGIAPLAHVSASRLFCAPATAVSDPRVWKDSAGRPIACSAAAGASESSLECYQADLRNTAWQDQAIATSLAALAAGATGVVLEGIAEPYEEEAVVAFVERLQRKAAAAKADARVVPLLSRRSLNWFPASPELFIEDGLWPRVRPTSISFEQGEIVVAGASQGPWIDLNLWLMACAETWSRGKPWHLAFQPNRAAGVEPDTVLPRGSLALAVAESASFGGSYVLSLDDELRAGLSERRPEALQQWTQAATLRDFIAASSSGSSWNAVSQAAVVIDDLEEASEILNLLGRRGLSYAVVPRAEFDKTALDAYAVVVAVNLPDLGKTGRQHLLRFARSGGIVVTNAPNVPQQGLLQSAAKSDESSYASYSLEKGQWVVYREAVSDPNEFAREVRALVPQEQRLVRLWNAPTVFTHLVRDTENKNDALHLLNYGLESVEELQVQVKGTFQEVKLLSPETSRAASLAVKTKEGFTEFTLPKLAIYGLVILQTERQP